MSSRRRPGAVPLVVGVVVVLVAVTVGLAITHNSGSSKPAKASGGATGTHVADLLALTVNGSVAPVGVDPDGVSFAWHLDDARKDAKQVAYRILVSRDANPEPGSSAVVWDGFTRSAQQAFVAYKGPRLAGDTEYWWTVQTTSAAGNAGHVSAFAPPQPFVTGLRDADWKAQWVRPGPADPGAEEYTYVRKEVTIGTSPIVRATAYVAAAHQYQLYIDGAKVAAGPSFAYPDEQYYEATDVTGALHAGAANAIGVLHHWYGPGQGRPASAPGLLLQITVVHQDGSREVIGTDGTWQEHRAEWLPAAPRNDEGGFTERVDGRLQPQGWAQPGFDAKGWTPVAVLGPVGTKPFTHLVAQRTHIVESPVRPVSVRTLPSGAVIADYGAVIAARPAVTFHDGVAGRPVAMHVGYVLDPDGHVSTTVAVQDTDLSFSYIERAGEQTFQAYTYLGFRYLEVDAPGEKLDPSQLVVYARHSAMPDENAGTFTSSVPILDKVFELVRHSALYVSQEQFVDTPTREKGQFLTDSFNDSQATMHAFGEQNLTWQALEDFARLAGPVLPRRQPQRRVPERRREAAERRLHRALSRMGLAVLPRDRRPRDARAALSGLAARQRLRRLAGEPEHGPRHLHRDRRRRHRRLPARDALRLRHEHRRPHDHERARGRRLRPPRPDRDAPRQDDRRHEAASPPRPAGRGHQREVDPARRRVRRRARGRRLAEHARGAAGE